MWFPLRDLVFFAPGLNYFSSIVNNLGMCSVARQPLTAKWEVFMGGRGENCVCVFTFSQLSFWKMTGHDRWVLKLHYRSIKHFHYYPSVFFNQSVLSRFRQTVEQFKLTGTVIHTYIKYFWGLNLMCYFIFCHNPILLNRFCTVRCQYFVHRKCCCGM